MINPEEFEIFNMKCNIFESLLIEQPLKQPSI